MDELARRAVNVLLALRTLSEVPAHTYNADAASHTAEKDRLPIKFTAAGNLAPAELSEFDFHRQRINESRTRDDFEVAVIGAEEALRASRHQSTPLERMEPEESRKEVIKWHTVDGHTAAEIASMGDYKVRWVKYVLRQHTNRNLS